ncbi:MAG: TlpA family protein disulfide reductase [Steroidobacteraceae bacterium]
MSNATGVTLGLAVLIASAACGYGYYRLSKPAHQTLYAVPPVAMSAPVDPSAATAPTTPARKVPESVPPLSLPGLDGVSHQLTQWRGHPLLVNFWATWCEPCRREIPLLEGLRAENAAKKLEIVGIAIDYRDPVQKYALANHMDYPILLGERGGFAAADAFGMDTVLPFSVFADSQGRVVALKVGELHRDEAELILDRIGRVDGGTLSLRAARDEIGTAIAHLAAARPAS